MSSGSRQLADHGGNYARPLYMIFVFVCVLCGSSSVYDAPFCPLQAIIGMLTV